MEMLVLDQTRPDIGLRVAKVIVPGMRHMWKRLGTGRLYDVPVSMGWLKEALTEDDYVGHIRSLPKSLKIKKSLPIGRIFPLIIFSNDTTISLFGRAGISRFRQ